MILFSLVMAKSQCSYTVDVERMTCRAGCAHRVSLTLPRMKSTVWYDSHSAKVNVRVELNKPECQDPCIDALHKAGDD